METINKDRAIELLEDAVSAKGHDYVYELEGEKAPVAHCVYAALDENGSLVPACIAGHVFVYAGIPAARLASLVDTVEGQNLAARLYAEGFEMTDGAKAVLGLAQNLQDNGVAWGNVHEAVYAVKNYLPD